MPKPAHHWAANPWTWSARRAPSRSARKRYRPSNRKPPRAARARSARSAHFSTGRASSAAASAPFQFPARWRWLRTHPPRSVERRCRKFLSGQLRACSLRDPSLSLESLLRVPWWPPRGLDDVLAGKTVRPGARDLHLHVFSQKIHVRRSKIYQTIAGSSSTPLRSRRVAPVNQHFIGLSDQLFVSRDLNLALPLVQNRKPAALFFLGNRIRHVHCRSVGPRRIFERENRVILC